MVWTETTRDLYRRDELYFASDLRDAEWELIEPLLPERRAWGRPRTVDMRALMNALLYILATGCQWRALPRHFPPRSTVQRYFYRWRDDGLWQKLVDALVPKARFCHEYRCYPNRRSTTSWSRSYQPAVKLTHGGASQSGESLNLCQPVGGQGHGCSDRIAGRL